MSQNFECKNINVFYGKRKIVSDVTLNLKPGSFNALVGANGCGKTTLLKGILGFAVMSGSVVVDGEETSKLSAKQRSRKFAYVPQFSDITYSIDVIDILLMGFNPYLSFWERPTNTMRNKVEEVAKDFGINDLLYQDYLSLSGGERQLVIMARLFLQDSDICLLDEPDSAMDFMNRHQSLSILSDRIKNEEKVALITIHDPNFALMYCDDIYMMKQGKIVSSIHVATASAEELEEQLSNIYGDIEVISYHGRYLMVKK